jgi:hypothetical protein
MDVRDKRHATNNGLGQNKGFRASSAVPREGPRTHFFHPDGPKWPSRASGSDLGFHPSGEPRSSPPPRGVLGEFGGNESARNVEKTSRVAGGPDLSATKADRRPHRIIFRAL